MSANQDSRAGGYSLTLLLNPRFLLQVLHVSQSFLSLYLEAFHLSVDLRQLHIAIGNGVFLLRNRLVEILQLFVETGQVGEFLRMQRLCFFQLHLGG